MHESSAGERRRSHWAHDEDLVCFKKSKQMLQYLMKESVSVKFCPQRNERRARKVPEHILPAFDAR